MLANLVQQRSQLAEEILNYLAEVVRQTAVLPDELQPNGNKHTRFDEIRQVVQVLEDSSGFETWRTAEPERLHCQPCIPKSPCIVAGDGRVRHCKEAATSSPG